MEAYAKAFKSTCLRLAWKANSACCVNNLVCCCVDYSADPPCIPYLGFYLTDLAFIEDGTPNNNENGLINFSKMRMVRNCLILWAPSESDFKSGRVGVSSNHFLWTLSYIFFTFVSGNLSTGNNLVLISFNYFWPLFRSLKLLKKFIIINKTSTRWSPIKT